MASRAFAESEADLELVGIQKRFPGFTAIERLDLTIPAGSFFALLGPSGCGKTTTLRLVAGLEDPPQGSVLIGGKDVTRLKPYERPVNTVFQSYALFPHMSVLENVAFGLRRRKMADPVGKAHEALQLVELDHLAGRKPEQLSGGQQQRVALARAIVNRAARRSAWPSPGPSSTSRPCCCSTSRSVLSTSNSGGKCSSSSSRSKTRWG